MYINLMERKLKPEHRTTEIDLRVISYYFLNI